MFSNDKPFTSWQDFLFGFTGGFMLAWVVWA